MEKRNTKAEVKQDKPMHLLTRWKYVTKEGKRTEAAATQRLFPFKKIT